MERKTDEEKIVWWWPDTNSPKGIKHAIGGGAGAAMWVCLSYVLNIAIIMFTGNSIVAGELDAETVSAVVTACGIAAVVAAFLAWRIWKASGYISATIVLIWILIEVAMKTVSAPGKGIVVSILAVLFAINGVRGTYASCSRAQQSTEEPE